MTEFPHPNRRNANLVSIYDGFLDLGLMGLSIGMQFDFC